MSKRKAPAGQGEGMTENLRGKTIVETLTETTDGPTAPEGEADTYEALVQGYKPTLEDLAAAQRYGDYTTHIVHGGRIADDSIGQDGREYRGVGAVAIFHDRRELRILLRQDAHKLDLDSLQAILRRIRVGHHDAFPWTIHASKRPKVEGETYEVADFGVVAEGARLGDRIVRCMVAECDDFGGYHFGEGPDDVTHWGDDLGLDGVYRIELTRYGSEPWGLSFDFHRDNFDDVMTGLLLRDIASMRAAATRLNGAEDASC